MADEVFGDDTFILLTKDKSLKDKVEEQISESGGAVARAINKRTTLVVCDSEADFEADLKKAAELKIPAVAFSFIEKSISAKARAKPEDHKLGSTNGSDSSGPSAKKPKIDEPSGVHKDSEWMGVSTGSDGTPYPFVLEITGLSGDNIVGGIKWPTLGKGAVTKIRGTVQGDQVKFEEYEAVQGADDVEIPMYYTGTVSGTTIKGKLKDSSGEESTFSLSKIKNKSGTPSIPSVSIPPPKDLSKHKGLPSFTPKSEFKGVLSAGHPLTLQLTTLTSEGKVEGVINWSSVAAKTHWIGEVKGEEILFEEKDVLVGEGVDIPVKYVGKIDDSTLAITGKYEAPSSTGTFNLDIKK